MLEVESPHLRGDIIMNARYWMIIGAIAALATACGPDNNGKNNGNNDNAGTNGTPNGTPNGDTNGTPNGTPNGDTNGTPNGDTNGTPNGDTNGATNGATNGPTNGATNGDTNGDTNNGTNNGSTTMEMEPNDDEGDETPFDVGNTLVGTADDLDDDLFAAALTGGQILELEVVATQRPNEIDVEVYSQSGDVPARYLPGEEGASRQFFIPTDETYVVHVFDYSGQPNNYEIATRMVDGTPTDVTLPVEEMGDLDDYMVDLYSFTAQAADEVATGIVAGGAPINSDLDPFLIVWSPNAGLVTLNDDISDSDFDSQTSFTPSVGEEYWLVVDAYDIVDGDNSYRLDALSL
jgi:hypothetical protein